MEYTKKDVDQYCADHSMGLSETAIELMEYTRANVEMSAMLIGPLEAAFIKFLIKSMNVKNILEIGTYTGFSALNMAEAIPADGKVVTIDINQETTDLATKYWEKAGVLPKIDARIGEGAKIIPELNSDFDLVFIDADKENYEQYFEMALLKTKPNALFLLDNCLWDNRVLNKEADIDPNETSTLALKKLNHKISNDPRFECVLTPIRDGIMMVRKRGSIGEGGF